jgi:hypothetical protein
MVGEREGERSRLSLDFSIGFEIFQQATEKNSLESI